MTITRHHDNTPTTLDAEEVFRFLGYNPTDPAARAVVGLCMRYQLDPFAGHIIVIAGRRSPYVTRDGHLWLAHRSGQFDGMETLDEWVKDEKYCYAKIAVWRKDMTHPFVYTGRCPIKTDRGGWDYNADKKAVANAEVRALKRAFPLQLPSIVDYEDDLETSDPESPPGSGSDTTSEADMEAGNARTPSAGQSASDPTTPEPNPAPTAAAGSGAPRPGRGTTGRRHATDDTESVKQAGSAVPAEGAGKGTADPSLPLSDEAEQADYDRARAEGWTR